MTTRKVRIVVLLWPDGDYCGQARADESDDSLERELLYGCVAGSTGGYVRHIVEAELPLHGELTVTGEVKP